MYQDERKLDFKPLGIAIKKAREAKGWTQEYLAQLVDLTPRSIMYIENRGQHPRLNKFYLITTLLDISVYHMTIVPCFFTQLRVKHILHIFPVHKFASYPRFCCPCHDILPKPLKLRIRQRLSILVGNYIV